MRQIVRRRYGLDTKTHVRRRYEVQELFGLAPPLPEQGVAVWRDDEHRTSGEARSRALVKDRPGYAQRHEGLPESDLVGEQDNLAAALVIVVVQAPQDGVDGALLPRCRFLHPQQDRCSRVQSEANAADRVRQVVRS